MMLMMCTNCLQQEAMEGNCHCSDCAERYYEQEFWGMKTREFESYE